MQRAPKRRFRGPRNWRAALICSHPSHPSVEWNYEIYQGAIGEVLICKNVLFLFANKSEIHTLDVLHSSQLTSETTRKRFVYTSYWAIPENIRTIPRRASIF